MALLTVMGLYNYDPTIFDSMVLPVGMDKTKLVNQIILDTAELEVIYPAPGFLKTAIGLWSATRNISWDRIYKASLLEYDPIENYDRQETETITGNQTHSGKDTTTNTGTSSGTTSGTSSGTTSGNATETNKIAGFDTTTLVDHDSKTTVASGTDSRTDSQTTELTHGEQIADSHSKTSRIHGNIGVTSQQMLEQEIAVTDKLNVYDIITNDFKNRFCILVY